MDDSIPSIESRSTVGLRLGVVLLSASAGLGRTQHHDHVCIPSQPGRVDRGNRIDVFVIWLKDNSIPLFPFNREEEEDGWTHTSLKLNLLRGLQGWIGKDEIIFPNGIIDYDRRHNEEGPE